MSSDMEGKMQDRYDALPSLEAEAAAFAAGAEAMQGKIIADLTARVSAEQIMRDERRRAGDQEMYLAHGDRTSAFQNALSAIHALPLPTMAPSDCPRKERT